MMINKTDTLVNNSFNEFISKENRGDFIWIGIIKKPNALKYHYEIYTMSSQNYLRVKSDLICTLVYDEFYESVNYVNAKTIRSAYAKSTEMLMEHLQKSPNSKVTIKDLVK